MKECAQVDCRRAGVNRLITTEILSKPFGVQETKYYSYYLCDEDAQKPLSERHIKDGSLTDVDFEKETIVNSVKVEEEKHKEVANG